MEAAMHAARHPAYAERYQHTARRLGRQRGAKIARVDIARRLADATWHMLTTAQPFAPAGAARVLVTSRSIFELRHRSDPPIDLILAIDQGDRELSLTPHHMCKTNPTKGPQLRPWIP
jgi:hypothetical protein